MKRKHHLYLLVLVCSTLASGCGNDEKPSGVSTTIPQKPSIMDPFRYHKLIEVSPGQDYDILSWGRGSSTVGAFEILHSDSASAKFTTTTGDLDGAIIDVFNTDMDLDGNPEILIEAKSKDTINYTNIYAFEFVNSRADKLEFPRLTQSQRQGYRGGDDFYVKDDKLIREFQIYNGTGKSAKPSGQKRQFEYGLRDNSFTVKQLSKDSTAVGTKVKSFVEKAPRTSPEKHHTAAKKSKKKKHKRHHSGDEG